jgi:hypothetical protein
MNIFAEGWEGIDQYVKIQYTIATGKNPIGCLGQIKGESEVKIEILALRLSRSHHYMNY